MCDREVGGVSLGHSGVILPQYNEVWEFSSISSVDSSESEVLLEICSHLVHGSLSTVELVIQTQPGSLVPMLYLLLWAGQLVLQGVLPGISTLSRVLLWCSRIWPSEW